MLKEASCYQEDGKWYISLRYEYEAKDGVNFNEYLRIHPGPIWEPVNKEMFVDDIMGIIEDENQID